MNRKKDELSYLKFTLSTRSRFRLVAELLLTIADPDLGFRYTIPVVITIYYYGSKYYTISNYRNSYIEKKIRLLSLVIVYSSKSSSFINSNKFK